MIYPKNFEQKLGFDQVRDMLSAACISSLGRNLVSRMQFLKKAETIQMLWNQTHEFQNILMRGEHFPASHYFDAFDFFQRIKTEGTFAEKDELAELRAALSTINDILRFVALTEADEMLKYPALFALSQNVFIEPEILKQINGVLDERGEIRSNASPTLSQIRQQKAKLDAQAGGRINQLFRQAKKEGWVDSNAELALRNGRQVIPIVSSYKRKIKGFVHDQSTSGQTVFLEPEEIFEINNEIRQLEFDERAEIVRILKELTTQLRPHLPALKSAFAFLGKIDFVRAKAKVAIEMEAQKPRLVNKPHVNWVKAKHPLLLLSHKAQKKLVEPLSIELNPQNHIMVISGPNAGGKSVCMKTLGLIQYMLQCGLLAPMQDYSEVGIFHKIFIDIGDEQSLENDLSTYSSHLANMKYFEGHADSATLFLIDEFGAGTEPGIGGAIAEAILAQLLHKKAYGIITTHYANLKVFAGKNAGVVNGSMLFDTNNMKPLFKLKIGSPGSSFAFEIAKTMGLSASILQKAKEIAGSEHVDFDQQLQNLELKKIELEEKEKQLFSGDAFLSEMIEKYEALNNELENRKKEILNEARIEAKKLLKDSNRIIESTIKEIRESNADKEKAKELREKVQRFDEDLGDTDQLQAPQSRKAQKKAKQKAQETLVPVIEVSPIEAGDFVRIKGQETIGEVISVSSRDAMVAFGSLKMKAGLPSLEKISKKSVKKTERVSRTRLDFNINEKAAEFNPNLDVRGQRAQDALVKARRFVDDAILLGVRSLKIVHGTGDGILREALRDYLKTLPEIKRTRDEHPDRGGAGCTLVEMNF